MVIPDFRMFEQSNELYHYGIPRRSGRYPWGSGERPYQSAKSLEKIKIHSNQSQRGKIEQSRSKLLKNKSVDLTEEQLNKFKSQYKNLNHVKIDSTTKGKLFLSKDNKVVAMINTEKKNDGTNWIQGLEVFGDNKGTGLSIGLLDIAVKELGADHLSVRKTNKVALKVYEEYGFQTYESNNFMNFMSIKDLKHSSEGEVNFKMNDFYYIAHGGPGSGRYPLGSGERPYQKFEGSGRRSSGGISGYIRSRKAKKAEENEQKRKNDEAKKQLEEAKIKRELEADKERVLRKGTATEVMKYQGELTNQELQSAFTRLNLESQIRNLSQREMQSSMDKVDKIMKTIKTGNEWAKIGTDTYNTIAAIYNATSEGQKKPLTLVGKGSGEKKK